MKTSWKLRTLLSGTFLAILKHQELWMSMSYNSVISDISDIQWLLMWPLTFNWPTLFRPNQSRIRDALRYKYIREFWQIIMSLWHLPRLTFRHNMTFDLITSWTFSCLWNNFYLIVGLQIFHEEFLRPCQQQKTTISLTELWPIYIDFRFQLFGSSQGYIIHMARKSLFW